MPPGILIFHDAERMLQLIYKSLAASLLYDTTCFSVNIDPLHLVFYHLVLIGGLEIGTFLIPAGHKTSQIILVHTHFTKPGLFLFVIHIIVTQITDMCTHLCGYDTRLLCKRSDFHCPGKQKIHGLASCNVLFYQFHAFLTQ